MLSNLKCEQQLGNRVSVSIWVHEKYITGFESTLFYPNSIVENKYPTCTNPLVSQNFVSDMLVAEQKLGLLKSLICTTGEGGTGCRINEHASFTKLYSVHSLL